MKKLASLTVAILASAAMFAPAAMAQQKPASPAPKAEAKAKAKPDAKAKTEAKAKPDAKAKPAGHGEALLLETTGKWKAYATQGQGKARICYALGKASDRKPANLKDVAAYLFISSRPAEGVRNEVSFVMNFDLKENVEHEAAIGDQKFVLVAKGQNLWLKNPAEEPRLLEVMRRGATLEVKAISKRNNATADRYELAGVTQTIKRAEDACK